jgi:hypothetical protein
MMALFMIVQAKRQARFFMGLTDGNVVVHAERNDKQNPLVVVVGIHAPGQHKLAMLVEALDSPRILSGFAESGQEHGGQDSDNGDDDEKFDQSEARLFNSVEVAMEFHHRSTGCSSAILSKK